MTDPIAAARRAGSTRPAPSPYDQQERMGALTKVYTLACWIIVGLAASRLDGWLSWALWAHLATSVLVIVALAG